jgi:hypothetical protein
MTDRLSFVVPWCNRKEIGRTLLLNRNAFVSVASEVILVMRVTPACFRRYAIGNFLGSYTEDIAEWSGCASSIAG